MKIPVPRLLVRGWDAFGAWSNVPLWPRHDLRRIDLILAACGIGCIVYYGWLYGPNGALQGAVMFAVVAALALFLRRG